MASTQKINNLMENLPIWVGKALRARLLEQYSSNHLAYYQKLTLSKFSIEACEKFGELFGFKPMIFREIEILSVRTVANIEPETVRLVASGGGEYLGMSNIAINRDGKVINVADLDTTSPAALEAVRFIQD